MDIEPNKDYSWSRTVPLISPVGGPIGCQVKGIPKYFSLPPEKLLNKWNQLETIDQVE